MFHCSVLLYCLRILHSTRIQTSNKQIFYPVNKKFKKKMPAQCECMRLCNIFHPFTLFVCVEMRFFFHSWLLNAFPVLLVFLLIFHFFVSRQYCIFFLFCLIFPLFRLCLINVRVFSFSSFSWHDPQLMQCLCKMCVQSKSLLKYFVEVE